MLEHDNLSNVQTQQFVMNDKPVRRNMDNPYFNPCLKSLHVIVVNVTKFQQIVFSEG